MYWLHLLNTKYEKIYLVRVHGHYVYVSVSIDTDPYYTVRVWDADSHDYWYPAQRTYLTDAFSGAYYGTPIEDKHLEYGVPR